MTDFATRPLRVALAVVAFTVAAGLSACGGKPELQAGSVTRLTFIAAHDTHSMVPIFSTICSSAGSTVVCHPILIGFVPVTEHHSDEYDVTMFACKRDGCRTATVQVSREVYGLLKIGTWFDRRYPYAPKNI